MRARIFDKDDGYGDYTTDVEVTANTGGDTSPPLLGLTLAESEPDQHVAGTTIYYNPSGNHSGIFTVVAKAEDPQSGILKVEFPSVFSSNDDKTDKTVPYQNTYRWTADDNAKGAKTVTAVNGAGRTTDATFTVQPDTKPPTVAITAPEAGSNVGPGEVVVRSTPSRATGSRASRASWSSSARAAGPADRPTGRSSASTPWLPTR